MSEKLVEILKDNRVIPVAAFDDTGKALRTAELLLKNSIGVLEITLRTESAFDCIAAVRKGCPDITVGAGSVLSLDFLRKASDSGAAFYVAPGLDSELIDYSRAQGLDFIPGISTPSELSRALKHCSVIKIFPISHLGGADYIKAITAPYRMKEFHLIPTGGVNEKNYIDYLKSDRVISCGMSYLVESALVQAGDFDTLESRMKAIVSGLRQQFPS